MRIYIHYKLQKKTNYCIFVSKKRINLVQQ